MTRPPLEDLRRQLREIDQDILHALSFRACFPRNPRPRWPETETRLPPPPLAEILMAIAPAGTAGNPAEADQANRDLVTALLSRQHLAQQIADAKADIRPDDFRAAMEIGNREKLLALLTDLPTELRLLDHIRKTAVEIALNLTGNLAPLLWREYLIPWTKQSEVAHLLEP